MIREIIFPFQEFFLSICGSKISNAGEGIFIHIPSYASTLNQFLWLRSKAVNLSSVSSGQMHLFSFVL